MASSSRAYPIRSRLVSGLFLSLLLLPCAWLSVSQAQVTTAIRPDGTLGTRVRQHGTVYTIRGGTWPEQGPNLFHSFDRFSVGTGDTVRFSVPPGTARIENILSRVTGGQQSVIDGQLHSAIPGANLYLLNPSGVVFGPNATLNVNGSFHVSTAEVLRFANGATFAARLREQSTLTVAPPTAFGFLGQTPAPITMQDSRLVVPAGATLAVVGGDITIRGGGLRAPSGQVHLASVASAGEVVPSAPGERPALHVDTVPRLGTLTLTQQGTVDASGGGQPGPPRVAGAGGLGLNDNGYPHFKGRPVQGFSPAAVDLACAKEREERHK